MNKNNRDIIIILCSHLCIGEDVKPYTIKEWSDIAIKLVECKKEPSDLLSFTNNDFYECLSFSDDDITRMQRLFNRSTSLAFELEKLENKGISIVTRADKEYPLIYKKKLRHLCPPLFYYAGNLDIINNNFIGFVGSRLIGDSEINFTKKAVKHFVSEGYSIVSGGAKGVDSTSTKTALEFGGCAVEVLSDSLIKKIKDLEVVNAIRDDKLLLLSISVPTAGFEVGLAMQRNKFIYGLSQKTIVVKSDYNKGGTWAGAKEAFTKDYTSVYCWDNKEFEGNQELIKLGCGIIKDDLTFCDTNK